jgi:hypothetical protein
MAIVESCRLAQVARPDAFQERSEQQVPEAKPAIEQSAFDLVSGHAIPGGFRDPLFQGTQLGSRCGDLPFDGIEAIVMEGFEQLCHDDEASLGW